MKILVADDNVFYARMLEHTLREWGYEVVVVGDGEAAWLALQEDDAPKLAILDWMMPKVDGLELCRRLRAKAVAEPTYVILLTAKDGKENVITGLEGGADDYVSKPFDRDELRARLQSGRRIVELQRGLAKQVKELEHALSVARRLEAMGRLAGGVAHDFNNLLTVILGGCTLLRGKVWQNSAQCDLLAMVTEAGERGTSLTRQLLAFSSQQVLAPRVFQLNSLVTGLEKLLRRLITEAIILRMDLDAGAGRVRADPGQMEQVLMNLVLNARDAMTSGGEIVVDVRDRDLAEELPGVPSSVPPGSYVALQVRDVGCGMDDAVKARIFDPFFTTKGPGKGTGLGLATVYGIVKQSCGFIQVASEPGRGTAFTVYLPQATEEAGTAMTADPAGPRALGQETILLVEDEDGVRAIAREILQSHDYTVLEASDGRTALRVNAEWPRPIDLLLTDVVMPHLDGRQLADSLLPLRPAMKVLYMSGYTDDVTVHRRASGARSAFLQKPFNTEGLVNRVRELLDR